MRFRTLFALLVLVVNACRDEPTSSESPGVAVISSVPIKQPVPAKPSAEPVIAVPSASATPAVDAGNPTLRADDGTLLPQSDEKPATASPSFKRRMRALARAILSGEISQARQSFFPLTAYAQVKGVQHPERDYHNRLLAHFERDLKKYHRDLGDQAVQATFLGATVPMTRAEWMKRGSEGNRLGYYRVRHSKLRLKLMNGEERVFDLASLISWRGEWYVVHLAGFD